jgi:thioesterase domain-containing protein
VHIVSRQASVDAAALAERFGRWPTDVLKIAPSHLAALWDRPRPELLPRRWLILGGEASQPRWVAGLKELASCQIANHYGPTETTVGVLTYRVPDEPDWASVPSVPIGRPLPNVRAYVLDEDLQPVPVGASGELCLAGQCVAQGYLNRPEETASRFVSDPFSTTPGARLYRSGDVARHLPDGNILFLGRADDQVKIRGYRVELGEVAAILRQHPALRDAAAALRDDAGDARLVGYVVPSGEQTPQAAELRRFLEERLPGYMVPRAFVALSELPSTPHGKLDRRALPAPGPQAHAAPSDQASPRNMLERQVLEVWRDVLHRPQLGVEDNFFDVGGHSLLAVKLFARLERILGRKMPLAALFQAPTVRQFADLIGDPDLALSLPTVIPLAPAADGAPFFCVASMDALAYLPLSRRLDGVLPLYVLQPLGAVNPERPDLDVPSLAARYAEAVRQTHPQGPYYLGGVCSGGVLAFETAQELRRQGQEVALLALIDTWYPSRGLLTLLNGLTDRFLFHARMLREHKGRQRVHYLRGRLRALLRAIQPPAAEGPPTEHAVVERYWRPLRAAYRRAFPHYEPQPYGGPMAIFLGAETPAGAFFDPRARWRRLAEGPLDVLTTAGNHTTMLREPHVRELAEGIIQSVQQARAADA